MRQITLTVHFGSINGSPKNACTHFSGQCHPVSTLPFLEVDVYYYLSGLARPNMSMMPMQRRTSFEAKKVLESLRSNLATQLARTEVVSRLQGVSFLGAIDHSPWASRTGNYLTSRFDHSIGVAYLAQRAAQRMRIDRRKADTALAAAMLHDVGHGPLSHSLETTFENEFGINHHKATKELVLGSSARARSLRSILEQFDLDAEEVVFLMSGKTNHPLAGLFSGPINFDTIEGILRAANYHPRRPAHLNPTEVVDALVDVWLQPPAHHSLQTLDRFWQMKGLIYTQLVRGTVGVISDFKCQMFFRVHRQQLSRAQFSWTDTLFKQRFPTLFRWLQDDKYPATDISLLSHIPYVKRTFTIKASPGISLSPNSFLHERYCQQKSAAVLEWHLETTVEEAMHIWNAPAKSDADANIANAY